MMDPMDHFHLLAAEDDLLDCFLHLPMSKNIPFVLSFETIAQLQQLREKKPDKFVQRLLAPNQCIGSQNHRPQGQT
jgi:hypothetical protein